MSKFIATEVFLDKRIDTTETKFFIPPVSTTNGIIERHMSKIKSEEVLLSIKLISSGDTSNFLNEDIIHKVMELLKSVNFEQDNKQNE